MSGDLRRQLRAQKKALRQSMAAAKKKARAQIDANPMVRRERARRRVRRLAGLGAVLALLLLMRCECSEAPAPTPPPPAPVAEEKPAPKKPKPAAAPKPKPMRGDLDEQPRGKLQPEGTPAPPWLEEFRLQVAARSPRLAECFKGVERPGALRWSTAVNASSGTVSAHELEPVGNGASMTEHQRDCVLKALSSPKYLISTWDADAEKALPNRVSIVIEF